MKTVILAGGFGTRISEETAVRPKPMIEIGGKPILWHIMSVYAKFGYNDFVVACGYKGDVIKEYFSNYLRHNSDLFINLRDGSCKVLNSCAPDWNIALVDTGLHTMTAGRLRRLREMVDGETFMVTYGDGLADIDIEELVQFHRRKGKLATITAVAPVARFGSLALDDEYVTRFTEKPQAGEGWINGGFFVFEPTVFDYLLGDDTVLEGEPLERLAHEGQLTAYRHTGFWHPMDTLRDKHFLESLWANGSAPWRTS
jgi:glucose-1-phosphate cytidylyltransferase